MQETPLDGRVDLHCHLLPGVDDGPYDLGEALAVAALAAADGTAVLACTPHLDPTRPTPPGWPAAEVAALQTELDRHGIPLRLVPGAELALDPYLTTLATRKILPTLGGGPYALVEYPFFSKPAFAAQVLFELQAAGLRLVLAHPERCAGFAGSLQNLEILVGRGVLVQVNAGSLLGAYGREVARAARNFLTAGLVHIIASDGHSVEARTPALAEAEAVAADIVGAAAAHAMVTTTPAAILAGNPLPPPAVPPVRPPKRGRPFRFPFSK